MVDGKLLLTTVLRGQLRITKNLKLFVIRLLGCSINVTVQTPNFWQDLSALINSYMKFR